MHLSVFQNLLEGAAGKCIAPDLWCRSAFWPTRDDLPSGSVMPNRRCLHFPRRRPSSGIWIVVGVVAGADGVGVTESLRMPEETSPRVACLKGVQKTTFRQTSATKKWGSGFFFRLTKDLLVVFKRSFHRYLNVFGVCFVIIGK